MSSELKQSSFNVKFNIIPKTKLESFKNVFTGYEEGLMQSEPGGFVMVPHYCENAEKIYQIQPRKDDFWLLTFPKCGTTWTSELLWQIVHGCDYETAAKIPLIARTPFPEMAYLSPASVRKHPNPMAITAAQIEKMPSPRIIRPHLPFYLLPPNLLDISKVVFVARNPKDVIVSYYFHHKLIKGQGFEGDIESFAQYFMDNEVAYAPFFPFVLDAWNKRHHPNMHFMFYEDMKCNLRGEIEKVAHFLDKKLTNDQLTTLTDHLKFGNFEKNESVNNEVGKKMGWMNPEGKFIRKGKTGDWMNHFSPELNQRIDEWIDKNLEGSDLKFVTQLEHQD